MASAMFSVKFRAQRGTLTHDLPFVSREFLSFCNYDQLWKDALMRVLQADPVLWSDGVRNLIEASGCSLPEQTVNKNSSPETNPLFTLNNSELVEHACKAMQEYHDENQVSYEKSAASVFRLVVMNHIRFSGPVFFMPGHVSMGQPFGLHFFEPRYRILVREVMANQPPSNFNGGQLKLANGRSYPRFIYANHSPLAAGTRACLVEIQSCHMYGNGTADVVLNPVQHVWIQDVWERPGTHGLCYGAAIKMGRKASVAAEGRVFRRRS
uniref:Uncharacterized protein n=1 Tax=Proboscia inermis TaxID=420281 RepID=A0A7S0GDL7_9STRA|mmetsp:Transcript_2272/g.2349  ORF Transcript_2272/g.2349 Transcript_2272/m.2349 type:complete len:267 (+) Transcript_2272:173-973(+)